MTVPSGGLGDWPTDCPVRIQVERVMGTFRHETAGDATGLLGHIISQDFYTHGVGAGLQVVTKLYRDPKAMVIEVDGVEVYRWIQNRDDLPSRLREQIIEEMRVGAVWAEMVDLQPGDEVLPGEVDGTYTIIRYDEELPLEEDDDEIIWD